MLLFNRLNASLDIRLEFVDIGNTSQLCWHVRDIWSRTDLGRFNGTFSASAVPPHGNRFLRLSAGAVCRVPSPPPAPACPPPWVHRQGSRCTHGGAGTRSRPTAPTLLA